jgi:kynurenine formamidase
MRDLLRDYLDGRLSRRRFFRHLVATGFTAAAARSLLEAADRGELAAADVAVTADTQRGAGGKPANEASRLLELTMPLDHEYMPDEILPTATPFILAPAGDPNKGITVGTETGTCLTLPSQFLAFRKTTRLHEVPPEKLVLRETVVVNIPKEEGQEISATDVDRALAALDFRPGDAVLLRTGWGDKEWYRTPGPRYIAGTPHFSEEAAMRLAQSMVQRRSDLLLSDLALIAWPDKHQMREWVSAVPRPRSWPSPEADIYLRTYTVEKMEADFAAALAFARAGVMTVKRLVNCRSVQRPRVRIIVGPLHLVRGVGSTCRVVAVEEA